MSAVYSHALFLADVNPYYLWVIIFRSHTNRYYNVSVFVCLLYYYLYTSDCDSSFMRSFLSKSNLHNPFSPQQFSPFWSYEISWWSHRYYSHSSIFLYIWILFPTFTHITFKRLDCFPTYLRILAYKTNCIKIVQFL